MRPGRISFLTLPYQAIWQLVIITFGVTAVLTNIVIEGAFAWLIIVIPISISLFYVLGGKASYFIFFVVRDISLAKGGIVRLRRFAGRTRVDLSAIESVERFVSNIVEDTNVETWRLRVRGRRSGIYVDERAEGFAILEEAMRARNVPISVGTKSFFRRQVLSLEPSTRT